MAATGCTLAIDRNFDKVSVNIVGLQWKASSSSSTSSLSSSPSDWQSSLSKIVRFRTRSTLRSLRKAWTARLMVWFMHRTCIAFASHSTTCRTRRRWARDSYILSLLKALSEVMQNRSAQRPNRSTMLYTTSARCSPVCEVLTCWKARSASCKINFESIQCTVIAASALFNKRGCVVAVCAAIVQ